MIEELIKIYNRDLERLKKEIELFNQEDNLWKTTGTIKNPAGNLCLHLVGNLSTYIGKNLGNIPYIRDREAEFNLKNVHKGTLIEKATATREVVNTSLLKMNDRDLENIYPENVLGYEMTNGFFLIHLTAHLSYHLGQINYIRRVFE
jgi:hypothetical protein